MPTLLRQKKLFLKLPPVEKSKYLSTWVNEIKSRYQEVLKVARHDTALVVFGKAVADAKVKCDVVVSKAKAHMSSNQITDFERRTAMLYDILKNHDKTVFGFERDILRPTSDGAKKHKLLVNVREEFDALEDLLREVKLRIEDSINLYDSYGSNKDVLDAVNNGRKLSTGLTNYRTSFLEAIKRVEDTNAKNINLEQEKDAINELNMRNLSLVERSENYLKTVKGLGRKYRGVTRKVAKDLGVLKPHWYPNIARKLDESGRKSGGTLLVKRLRDLAYSGADSFPDPATIYLKEIRAQRVIPDVKELASACILLGTDAISEKLTSALALTKDVQEVKQHSSLLAKDVEAVKSIVLGMLIDSEVKKHRSYTPTSKAGVQKLLVSLQASVVRKYSDDVVDYIEKYIA